MRQVIMDETRIPLPKCRNGHCGPTPTYPVARMKLRGSFLVKGAKGLGELSAVYTAAKKCNIRITGRKVAGGCRFWRVK